MRVRSGYSSSGRSQAASVIVSSWQEAWRYQQDTVTQNMKRCGATGSQTTRARTGGRIGRGILIAAGVLVALFAAYVFLIAAIFSVTPD
jgi:hypothetical protein